VLTWSPKRRCISRCTRASSASISVPSSAEPPTRRRLAGPSSPLLIRSSAVKPENRTPAKDESLNERHDNYLQHSRWGYTIYRCSRFRSFIGQGDVFHAALGQAQSTIPDKLCPGVRAARLMWRLSTAHTPTGDPNGASGCYGPHRTSPLAFSPRRDVVGVPGCSMDAVRPTTRPLLKARDSAEVPAAPVRGGLRLPRGVSGSSSVSSCDIPGFGR